MAMGSWGMILYSTAYAGTYFLQAKQRQCPSRRQGSGGEAEPSQTGRGRTSIEENQGRNQGLDWLERDAGDRRLKSLVVVVSSGGAFPSRSLSHALLSFCTRALRGAHKAGAS